MKVRITFTLDIDRTAWWEEFGRIDRRVVADDVRAYAEAYVRAHFESLELLTDGDRS